MKKKMTINKLCKYFRLICLVLKGKGLFNKKIQTVEEKKWDNTKWQKKKRITTSEKISKEAKKYLIITHKINFWSQVWWKKKKTTKKIPTLNKINHKLFDLTKKKKRIHIETLTESGVTYTQHVSIIKKNNERQRKKKMIETERDRNLSSLLCSILILLLAFPWWHIF